MIMIIDITIIIIIIITTRPKPAFGWLGLGGLSGVKTLGEGKIGKNTHNHTYRRFTIIYISMIIVIIILTTNENLTAFIWNYICPTHNHIFIKEKQGLPADLRRPDTDTGE